MATTRKCEKDKDRFFITLAGRPVGTGNDDRVTAVVTLIESAKAWTQHIDGLRQRNITIALAVFAGLFGFGRGHLGTGKAVVTSVALAGLMLAFTLIDRKLHKLTHGWRESWWKLGDSLAEVVNGSGDAVKAPKYCVEAEKNAEWWSLQPVVYYCLVVGGGLSFLVFR